MMFPTAYAQILERIIGTDPLKYALTRNYTDGAVTRLSPYISRGVISGKQVLESVLNSGIDPRSIEKFIQELAWRDYWQNLWIAKGEDINGDLKQPQPLAERAGLPQSMLEHNTGIAAVDQGIIALYDSGYVHNHLRMYMAAMACNVGRCHWKLPAQWMYYHLLDADWASNALSWQWVSGSNSHKLYYANQENINKYAHTEQHLTFLDKPYEQFADMPVPATLKALQTPLLQTLLPATGRPLLYPAKPTLVYNLYNLDPQWRTALDANRILLLEPSVFKQYPVSEKTIAFCTALANENIPGVQIWTAEFTELQTAVHGGIYYKEHPLNRYTGIEDARSWLSDVKGDFPSFSAFWKHCKKAIF